MIRRRDKNWQIVRGLGVAMVAALVIAISVLGRVDHALAARTCSDLFAPARGKDLAYIEAVRQGLHIVEERGPGFSRTVTARKNRQRDANGKPKLIYDIKYFDLNGRLIVNAKTIERLNALAIPVVYENVWISPDPQSHLQAWATAENGKPQYVYHPKWVEIAKEYKFEKIVNFGGELGRLRLALRKLINDYPVGSKERTEAVLLLTLDQLGIRIGGKEFALDNDTYGLTTMRKESLVETKFGLHFVFFGKHSKPQDVLLTDVALIHELLALEKLAGEDVFQYRDQSGLIKSVTPEDINNRIKLVIGNQYSAKDFRTWIATKTAAMSLYEMSRASGILSKDEMIDVAVTVAADKLGNTKKICLESYIHPQVLTAFRDGKPFVDASKRATRMHEQNPTIPFEDQLALAILTNPSARPK